MNTKLLIICLLISSAVFGQTPPGYTKINARYDWISGKFDSSLHIPGYATTPNYRTGAWVGAGNVGIDTVGNKFYYYSGGRWRVGSSASSQLIPEKDEYNYTNINLSASSFLDSTLTNSLGSGAVPYYNNGMILTGSYSGAISGSYLKAWNYGNLMYQSWSQRLVFQVLDSATTFSIGVGIIPQAGSLSGFLNLNYIAGTIGDSVNSKAYCVGYTQNDSTSGVLINYQDVVQLTVRRERDSVYFIYNNLTNGTFKKTKRLITFVPDLYTNVAGTPTVYFKNGNVKIIDYGISNPTFDYVFLGNSIGAGYKATNTDSGHVSLLQKSTSAIINNSSQNAAYTYNYIQTKNNLNFTDKVVFLDGVFGNDYYFGFTTAQIKSYYSTLVSNIKAKGNTVIHISVPYRTTFTGSQPWVNFIALNNWLDTAFGATDKVIHLDSLGSSYYADGVHFNSSGHLAIANNIIREVPWLFKENIVGRFTDSLHVDNIVSTGDSLLLRAKQGQSFYTAGVNRMVIDASGNVGIGTTPDSSNLKTGSISLGYHKVTANNYITQPGDYTLSVDNGASNWNVYLPTAAGNPGRVIVVKRYDDNSTGNVFVYATGGNVQGLDGTIAASMALDPTGVYGFSAMFQSNGTTWEYIK